MSLLGPASDTATRHDGNLSSLITDALSLLQQLNVPASADSITITCSYLRQQQQHTLHTPPRTPPQPNMAGALPVIRSRDDLLLTLPRFLELARHVVEAHPVRPAAVPSVNLNSKRNGNLPEKQRLALSAPQYLRPMLEPDRFFTEPWLDLHDVFAHHQLLDPPRYSCTIHPDHPNEATLDTWLQHHAIDMTLDVLNAAARLAQHHTHQSGLADALDASPLLASVHDKRQFSSVAQIVLPEQWAHRSLAFCDLAPALDDASIPDQALASRAGSLPEADEALKQLDANFLGATRPDNELVCTTAPSAAAPSRHLKFLVIEAKRKDAFCPQYVQAALTDPPGTWFVRHHLEQAQRGQLPVRDALIALGHRNTVLSNSARYVFECIAQLWRYMVQRGHTYGIVTSAVASVILKIDWSISSRGHHAEYLYFEPGKSQFATPTQVYTPTLPEMVLVIAMHNLHIGAQSNDTIQSVAIDLERHYALFQPSGDDSDDDDDDDDQDEHEEDDDDEEHLGSHSDAQRGAGRRDGGGGVGGRRRRTDAEGPACRHGHGARSDEDPAQYTNLKQLMDKLSLAAPAGYMYCMDQRERFRLLNAALLKQRRSRPGEPNVLERVLVHLWPRNVLACTEIRLGSTMARCDVGCPGTSLSLPSSINLPPSPPSSIETDTKKSRWTRCIRLRTANTAASHEAVGEVE